MEQSRVVCPKCRSKDLRVTEMWSSQIEHIQINGEIDTSQGEKEHLYPIGLHASCSCGHFWQLRGARQINDILSEKKNQVHVMVDEATGETFTITT